MKHKLFNKGPYEVAFRGDVEFRAGQMFWYDTDTIAEKQHGDFLMEAEQVMNLCEPEFLCLRPGVLYRFIVGKDCEKCAELAHSANRFSVEDHEQKVSK